MFFYHQSHNDALDDHRRITMDEYKKEYRKVEIRNCETKNVFFFQAEDGIRDYKVTGVQTCALPI